MIVVPCIIIGTQAFTAIINGVFKIDKSWIRHLVSWIIAISISLIFVSAGFLTFGFDILGDYIAGAVAGILGGGAANGFYDWKVISDVFEGIENKIRGPERKRIKS